MFKSSPGSGVHMCVLCVFHAANSHVNRAIIHVEERIHSQGLALLAGDDEQAFQGTSESWSEPWADGKKRRTGREESIIPCYIISFAFTALDNRARPIRK